MKKIYRFPALKMVVYTEEQMIAASPDGFDKNLDKTGGDGSDALIKGTTISYNVWDDDWSK